MKEKLEFKVKKTDKKIDPLIESLKLVAGITLGLYGYLLMKNANNYDFIGKVYNSMKDLVNIFHF